MNGTKPSMRTEDDSAPGLVIDAAQATLGYQKHPAVKDLNFQVQAGEVLALIGPNGAGKTTLLRALLGEVEVQQGSLTVLGGHTRPGQIGYVPQAAAMDPTFPVTAAHVVGMGLIPRYRLPWAHRSDMRRQIEEALQAVGLIEKKKVRFGDLSGGQRQRVLLARALVAEPALLLLDEPFNGLDEPNRKALLDIILKAKTKNITAVVSTHDLILATETADKVLLLAGKQIAYGATKEMMLPHNIARAYGKGHDATVAPASDAQQRGAIHRG